ncbi:class A sortase [Lactobacillus sp. ESL0228]|uniref:class A sortase n=1 Tax=Lactobacillus sp. ESL0228 TaxID=2069352 RepID=UPI001F1B0AD2|nr:class A sortase [Lactobacillus sp. ESL0228]
MTTKTQNYSLKQRFLNSIIVLFLGMLFYLGITLVFFGSGIGNAYLIKNNSEKASSNLTAQKIRKNQQHKTTYDASKTESVSTVKLIKSQSQKAYSIGQVSIPAVNIHVPLFAGYGKNNQNLSYGVVTCLPNRSMGGNNNYVLAGHYMGSANAAVLDNLHLTKPGDLVYITDLRNIYLYRIKKISVEIKPNQIEVENNVRNKPMITLITCSDFNTSKYGYGANRTVAQGKLVGQASASITNLRIAELIKSKNKAYSAKNKLILTNKKVIHKSCPRAAAQPKFYQNQSFIKISIITFNIIFLIIISWLLIKIW